MKKKNTLKLNENALRSIIRDTLKRALNEEEDDFRDVYPDEISPEERQRQMDSDWSDIDHVDNFDDKLSDGSVIRGDNSDDYIYDVYGNMSNWRNKYGNTDGHLSIDAQDPSYKGDIARERNWASKPIGTNDTTSLDCRKNSFGISESKLISIIKESLRKTLRENNALEK